MVMGTYLQYISLLFRLLRVYGGPRYWERNVYIPPIKTCVFVGELWCGGEWGQGRIETSLFIPASKSIGQWRRRQPADNALPIGMQGLDEQAGVHMFLDRQASMIQPSRKMHVVHILISLESRCLV